jgi:uncharacterized metal-binding protein YceD (DUF177 family)
MSLSLPLRKICDNECQQPSNQNQDQNPLHDSRWDALAALKKQLS